MFRSLPLLTVTVFCTPIVAADTVEIRLSKGTPPAIEVAGVTPSQARQWNGLKPDSMEWAAVLRVVVADGENTTEKPAVLGSYRVVGDRLRFEPRFPLVAGIRYRAVFAGASEVELSVPKPQVAPSTVVAQVYPTASVLPENTLRLYIQFSAPMSRGGVYRHLSLLDAAGKSLPSPFLELGEELWSTDRTRFTLFFDPARVKRGLVPRKEEGSPLEAGKRYMLVISPEWPDADGRPLRVGFRKYFSVGPMDSEPVNPQAWAVSPPSDPERGLVVQLPKPLDRGMLQRMVWVTDDAGKTVNGMLSVGGGERVLAFAPAKPWTPGRYYLVTDTRLEDPCGNRVGEAFEVDETKPPQMDRVGTTNRLFVVK